MSEPLREEVEATWRLPSGRLHDRWYRESYVDGVIAQEASQPYPLLIEKVTRRRLVTDWRVDPS